MTATLLVSASGALVALYATIGLFFLEFFFRSRDRLFAFFAAAFFILSGQRLLLTLAGEWAETSVWVYGLRLVAFIVIIVAIVEKNREASRPA